MPVCMRSKMVCGALCVIAALSPSALARDYSPAAVEMFRELRRQPNDLARYVYLVKAMQALPDEDRPLAMQMFASVENELGLYNEALRDFPLKSRVEAGTSTPTPTQWKAVEAVEVIAQQAADRRIVMVNEAHHDAHTRQLTLALLPRLRALGFNYFAAEVLVDKDAELTSRGYPTKTSGTEYLLEPSYGEIVRTAIKLGFKIVSYDVDSGTTLERETGQARNLYRKVFAKDPDARLFVHAGYAHIDKAKGRLGSAAPMAMQLEQLTGITPLSIDQTQFREQVPGEADTYSKLTEDFSSNGPFVLIERATGKPWSAHPDRYDINVLLPPAAGQRAVESGYAQPSAIVHDTVRKEPMLSLLVNTQRPEWLTLNNERVPFTISTTLCRVVTPCVVDAHYVDEGDDAIAADRYAFMQGDTTSKLYLRPGRYRLRAWDVRGRTLSQQVITIKKR